MGKTVDFDRVRKRRQRATTIKRLLILAGVARLAFFLLSLNEFLVEEGMSTYINDIIDSFGGDGYPVPVPGGVIRDVGHIGNSLTVLNDTNLCIYNDKGKRILNAQQMSGSTIMSTGSNRVLTFDIGSKKYSIFSRSQEVAARTTEDSIVAGDISESGYYALVTSPRQYVASVTVYNKQNEVYFAWNSAESLVSEVSISPKGNMIAVACIGAEDGVLKSWLRVFRFSSGKEVARVELDDSLIVNLDFFSESHIGVLTEKGYAVFDTGGGQIGEYLLDGEELVGFRSLEGMALVLTRSREARTQQVVLLDANASRVGLLKPEEKVLGMEMSPTRIYLLDVGGVTSYTHEMISEKRLEQRNIDRIYCAGAKLYYFTSTEICEFS